MAPKSRSAGARVLIALVLLAGSSDASSQSVAATPWSREGPALSHLASKSSGEDAASTSLGRGRGSYLSFPERVAYQYEIEEVRWRHRIWPKDNPGPKPPLDAVISREEVENKVIGYLEQSRALVDYLPQLITAAQLQAEMDRMARHTRQPEVLRELFVALGNNPFVIAECLARPVLAERLVNELIAKHGVEAFVAADVSVLGTGTSTAYTYTLPEISTPLDCADDTWTATNAVNAPDPRYNHTAVWTGSEMIVWGGANDSPPYQLNTGARYDPAEDAWMSTSTVNAPTRRVFHSAVWTGTEVIVWGGQSPSLLNTGGRYNPASDSWAATSIINAPPARIDHTAVWTGEQMIVWGGTTGNVRFDDGARYDPGADTWTPTSATNAPVARFGQIGIWTGSEMIIWGGSDFTNYLNTGGRYNPAIDSWAPTGLTNVPLGRYEFTGMWTGVEMIVWGGLDETFADCNTGGRYNPTKNSWVATSLVNAPSLRDSHTAVWTGSKMIVWAGVFCCPAVDFNTGGRYDAGTDSWTATSIANAPLARWAHRAVWTGTEMIAWGGFHDHDPNTYLNTGGIYCAQSGPTSTPSATPTATLPATPSPTPTLTPSVTPTASPTITPTPTPSSGPAQPLNISTRLRVETGDNVAIGGVIVSGKGPKNVVVRGIGPSLAGSGISDPLADTVLELRDGSGVLLFQNDNWQDDSGQATELIALGLAPSHPNESGIVAILEPNASYTAVLAGKNNETGVGLVEIYDTNQSTNSQLANISTRGLVQTGDNVMIGGFILGGGGANTSVAVRGIGPSLTQIGLTNVLRDPTLELRDSNGALLVSNDNWQDDPASASQLAAHGLALQNPLESGIFTSLIPGAFTAILAGTNSGTGIGLVEIYNVGGN